jgi:predicted aldo/keto reductase-like oxidoreductase
MKKLGFGLMRLPLLDPNDDASIDLEQAKQMVDLFMERGFTYFDTAIMYHNCASQRAAKEILVDRYPRDSFTLATKLHSSYFHSFSDRDRVFSEQLEQTGAGYFDYYLIHGVEASNYPKYEQFDCFNWVLEKKAQGLVRHAGFSFHDTPELLDEILTKYPALEFVQIQLNYLDWESENVQSRAVYEVAVKHNKPVVVMEPVKGGTLANPPEAIRNLFKAKNPEASIPSWAIRFVASHDGILTVLSGMSSIEQMADNTSYMKNFQPMSEDEMETIHQAQAILAGIDSIPCTGCSYCTAGCPQEIPIPDIFTAYNLYKVYGNLEAAKRFYRFATRRGITASDCVECGQCESVCPQNLSIIEELKNAAKVFDD